MVALLTASKYLLPDPNVPYPSVTTYLEICIYPPVLENPLNPLIRRSKIKGVS